MLYEIFYRPLFNALFFIYNNLAFHDLGIAIVLLTLVIRLILYPLFQKGARNQAILQRLQPRVKEIQDRHKNDRGKQTEAMLALYREHKANPFSSFLVLLVQLPVFIGLYRVFSSQFTDDSFHALYSFIAKPDFINSHFLGLINLYESSMVLVILAALFQFLQGYYSLPQKTENSGEGGMAEQVGRQMVYMAPVITIVVLWRFPSAVALYWTVTSIFSVVQQILVNKSLKSLNI